MSTLFDDLPLENGNVLCPKCKSENAPGVPCWKCVPASPAVARSADPPASHDAATRVDTQRLENLVLLALQSTGARGATSKDLALSLKVERVSISPRMKPLERKRLIRRSSEKRDGSHVWHFIGDE